MNSKKAGSYKNQPKLEPGSLVHVESGPALKDDTYIHSLPNSNDKQSHNILHIIISQYIVKTCILLASSRYALLEHSKSGKQVFSENKASPLP